MRDLAASVDDQVARGFARINGISEEGLEQRSEQLALPITEGGMVLKRPAWMTEGAHVTSWLQCAQSVKMPRGPQMRHWNEATLPCQQAVKAAHEELHMKAGVNAMSIARTRRQTLHQSCKTKLQKAIAMNITET